MNWTDKVKSAIPPTLPFGRKRNPSISCAGRLRGVTVFPDGYDTIVGSAGGHLSGGERQRISIARAMLKNAPIIILDEATAYTDPENEALIQHSVAKLIKGKTLIVIAHRLSTIVDADQIFVIENGTVAETGTHNELLANGEIYSNMWRAHMSVKDSEQIGRAHV